METPMMASACSLRAACHFEIRTGSQRAGSIAPLKSFAVVAATSHGVSRANPARYRTACDHTQWRNWVLGTPISGCSGRSQRAKKVGRRFKAGHAFAIDAAQVFDYEAVRLREVQRQNKLKVGIVGFGNFGQFLAERIANQGHTVLAHSRSDYAKIARVMGVTYYRDPDDFCEEHPDIVMLCTSILSTEAVLQSLPVQRLKRNTLFVDVLSVKEFPRNLFLQVLPSEFDVLCTHPMFGPESGKGSWAGLPFVYDKIRITDGPQAERCARFLNIFESEGCRMVEMTCEEHDRYAAGSQFITHTVGRVLGSLALESTPINTQGYESLLKLVDNTFSDSFDLYYGLFLYNANAIEELTRLECAFDTVKGELFDKLHEILRQQMVMKCKTSDTVSMSTTVTPILSTQLVRGSKSDASQPLWRTAAINRSTNSSSVRVHEVAHQNIYLPKVDVEVN